MPKNPHHLLGWFGCCVFRLKIVFFVTELHVVLAVLAETEFVVLFYFLLFLFPI